MSYIPSPDEVEKAKTQNGGWTKETLASWGIDWPPQKGWRKELRKAWDAANNYEVEEPLERIKRYIRDYAAVITSLENWKTDFLAEFKIAIQEDEDRAEEIANIVYWNFETKLPNVSVKGPIKDIYKSVYGKAFVPQKLLEEPCPVCGQQVYVSSHEKLQKIESGTWNTTAASECCLACEILEREYKFSPHNVIFYPSPQIHELSKMKYSDFLNTEYWKKLREIILKRFDNKCSLCGTHKWNGAKELHVHHNSYDHRGYEFYSDLIVLCKSCHQKYHNKVEGAVTAHEGQQ